MLQREVGDDGQIHVERLNEPRLQRQRLLLIGRLQRLQRLGLADETQPGTWAVQADAEKTLRALGERGDIIRTLQRAMGGQPRELAVFEPGQEGRTVIGRVTAKGLADELRDRGYLIIDGVDGKAHYVALNARDELANYPTGSVVEVRGSAETVSYTHLDVYKRQLHRFSWINEWKELADARGTPLGIELILPDWFYAGVLDAALVLTIDPAYFRLTGGIERWLYRLVRKHGGKQPDGWQFDFRHLHRKSGSTARFCDFACDLRALVARQSLPGYVLGIERIPEASTELLTFRSCLLYTSRGSPRSLPAGQNSSVLGQSSHGTSLPNRTAPRRLGRLPRDVPSPT